MEDYKTRQTLSDHTHMEGVDWFGRHFLPKDLIIGGSCLLDHTLLHAAFLKPRPFPSSR